MSAGLRLPEAKFAAPGLIVGVRLRTKPSRQLPVAWSPLRRKGPEGPVPLFPGLSFFQENLEEVLAKQNAGRSHVHRN